MYHLTFILFCTYLLFYFFRILLLFPPPIPLPVPALPSYLFPYDRKCWIRTPKIKTQRKLAAIIFKLERVEGSVAQSGYGAVLSLPPSQTLKANMWLDDALEGVYVDGGEARIRKRSRVKGGRLRWGKEGRMLKGWMVRGTGKKRREKNHYSFFFFFQNFLPFFQSTPCWVIFFFGLKVLSLYFIFIKGLLWLVVNVCISFLLIFSFFWLQFVSFFSVFRKDFGFNTQKFYDLLFNTSFSF